MTTTPTPSDTLLDRNGLEVLPVEECWAMIERAVLGRLAFQHEGGTIILPVTHVLDGRTVLFRSTRGSKFDASVMARPAVFEVDEWDAASRTGASVIVNGTLDVVDDTEALDQRGHTPWAPLTGEPLWLQLRALDISGRRIRPDAN